MPVVFPKADKDINLVSWPMLMIPLFFPDARYYFMKMPFNEKQGLYLRSYT